MKISVLRVSQDSGHLGFFLSQIMNPCKKLHLYALFGHDYGILVNNAAPNLFLGKNRILLFAKSKTGFGMNRHRI